MTSDDAAAAVSHPLELILRLCEALAAEGVRYCHWKSTATLDRAQLGEGDLDLLVDRRCSQDFLEILGRLGFKAAHGARELPGVFHAYGLDAPSGKLVHIHAHFALVLGDDMTKNYRLPVEDAYLASTTQQAVFRVPAPQFELAVLVIRLVLKHAAWDATLIGLGPLGAAERHELEDLTRRVSPAVVHDCVRTHLPFIGESVWQDCRRALEPAAPPWARVLAARRLEAALASCGRRPWYVDTPLKLSRRASGFLLRRLAPRRRPRLRLDSGGALIAIVGGDDLDRSTTVAALHAWLARDFESVRIRLATAPRAVPAKSAMGTSRPAEAGVRSFLDLVRQVFSARSRHRESLRARRLASQGALVICDGFPLPRPCSGGEIAPVRPLEERGGTALSALARLETYYRDQIPYPDLLLVLGPQNSDAVEEKEDTDWRNTPVCVLDADAAQADVLADAKRCVWSGL